MRTRRDLYGDAPRRADATAMPTRRAVRRRRAMWMRRRCGRAKSVPTWSGPSWH